MILPRKVLAHSLHMACMLVFSADMIVANPSFALSSLLQQIRCCIDHYCTLVPCDSDSLYTQKTWCFHQKHLHFFDRVASPVARCSHLAKNPPSSTRASKGASWAANNADNSLRSRRPGHEAKSDRKSRGRAGEKAKWNEGGKYGVSVT